MTATARRAGARFPAADASARLRLVCFTYAGGSPSVFRGWPRYTGDRVQVVPVLLPGRGLRSREAPYTTVEPITAEVADALQAAGLTDRFVLFGHSMGALLAYEVACELRRRGAGEPLHFFVSASRAPHLYGPASRWPQDDEGLRQLVRDLGGLGPDEEMGSAYLEQQMETLRADLAVCGAYRWTPRAPLSCPMTAISAAGDAIASQAEVEAWRGYTERSMLHRHLPGGHFYLGGGPPLAELMDVVRGELNGLDAGLGLAR